MLFKLAFCTSFIKPVFIALLLCLGVVNQLSAQYFELDSNRKRVSFPFRLIRNMVVVEANINNKGPFNFILDTGVGLMLITDPTLVDSLNINNKRTVKITGLGEGGDAEAFITSPLDINIYNIKSHNVAAAILKKDHFSLSNFLGMPVHGLLGYEFFSRLAIQVNFADSIIFVTRPADFKLFKRGERISINIEERKPYINTKVTMPNGTVSNKKLIIDLGAGHPVSLENSIKNKGLPERFIAANLGIGLNGPISGFISRVRELDIGSFKIKGPLTSFPEDNNATLKLSVARDGNLGTGILKRFNVIFDYYNSAMYLKKNRNYKTPFEHDMSGLEYYAGGKDHKHIVISRVEPGSPAYELGLEKYDEIVTINFKPVAKMTLEEIDDLFRSKHGRNILLEVYHDKKTDHVILTLKRRI